MKNQMLWAYCKKTPVGIKDLVRRCQQMDLTFALSGQQSHVCSKAESKRQGSLTKEQWTGVVPLAVHSAASLWESQGIQDVELSAGMLRGRQKRSQC